MTSDLDSAALDQARDNIAQAILLSPFEGPMAPETWDSLEMEARSQAIQDLFGEDLNAVAAAGDIGSLRAFFNSSWMDSVQLHRARGQWAQSLFASASLDILPALIDELATPHAVSDAYQPGSPTTSTVWRDCVGVALGRAQGDPAVLSAVERHLRSAVFQYRTPPSRVLTGLLQAARSGIAPDDLSWTLSLASSAFLGNSAPDFCSCAQAIFVDLFPSRPSGPPPDSPPTGLDIERVRRLLAWAAEERISDEDHPLPQRLLSLSACFGRAPELAPDLARLFQRHEALEGCALDPSQIHHLEVAIPPGPEKPPMWDTPRLPWASARMSPVDQALAWGAEDAALALTQAGFAWRPEPFIESCRAAMAGPQGDGPWSHCLVRPLVCAERLALSLSASPAPKPGAGAPRI